MRQDPFQNRTTAAVNKYLAGRRTDMDRKKEHQIFRDWFNSITTIMNEEELRGLMIHVYSEIHPDAEVLEVLTRPTLIDIQTTKRSTQG